MSGGNITPKLIIHSPAGTFDAADRQRVAGALTTLGLNCEALPSSPMVRSTVWTYFADYAADAVFRGQDTKVLPASGSCERTPKLTQPAMTAVSAAA